LAEKRMETIQADLDKRIKAAADAERAGNAPGEALLKDIESLRRQINNNNQYIAEQRQEQEQVKQEYAANIERFKKLKGIE
jgi:methyl-accepting chemotaxis protein